MADSTQQWKWRRGNGEQKVSQNCVWKNLEPKLQYLSIFRIVFVIISAFTSHTQSIYRRIQSFI